MAWRCDVWAWLNWQNQSLSLLWTHFSNLKAGELTMSSADSFSFINGFHHAQTSHHHATSNFKSYSFFWHTWHMCGLECVQCASAKHIVAHRYSIILLLWDRKCIDCDQLNYISFFRMGIMHGKWFEWAIRPYAIMHYLFSPFTLLLPYHHMTATKRKRN